MMQIEATVIPVEATVIPVPLTETIIFISVFLLVYLFWLVRNTIKNEIDLYDLIYLSSVALVPAAFVYFPQLTYDFSQFLGVAFPFVVLFGALFSLVFVYLYRLIKKINYLSQKNVTLIQEVSLLKNANQVSFEKK